MMAMIVLAEEDLVVDLMTAGTEGGEAVMVGEVAEGVVPSEGEDEGSVEAGDGPGSWSLEFLQKYGVGEVHNTGVGAEILRTGMYCTCTLSTSGTIFSASFHLLRCL